MFRLQVSDRRKGRHGPGKECDEGDRLPFRGPKHGFVRAAYGSCRREGTGGENCEDPVAGDDPGNGTAGHQSERVDRKLHSFGEGMSRFPFIALLPLSVPPHNLSLIAHSSPRPQEIFPHSSQTTTHPHEHQPFWFLFKYYPASPTDYAIASKNPKQLTGLLESGKVRPVRHRLVEGGLETGIVNGFEEMQAGRVRGEKLVVRVGGER